MNGRYEGPEIQQSLGNFGSNITQCQQRVPSGGFTFEPKAGQSGSLYLFRITLSLSKLYNSTTGYKITNPVPSNSKLCGVYITVLYNTGGSYSYGTLYGFLSPTSTYGFHTHQLRENGTVTADTSTLSFTNVDRYTGSVDPSTGATKRVGIIGDNLYICEVYSNTNSWITNYTNQILQRVYIYYV